MLIIYLFFLFPVKDLLRDNGGLLSLLENKVRPRHELNILGRNKLIGSPFYASIFLQFDDMGASKDKERGGVFLAFSIVGCAWQAFSSIEQVWFPKIQSNFACGSKFWFFQTIYVMFLHISCAILDCKGCQECFILTKWCGVSICIITICSQQYGSTSSTILIEQFTDFQRSYWCNKTWLLFCRNLWRLLSHVLILIDVGNME